MIRKAALLFFISLTLYTSISASRPYNSSLDPETKRMLEGPKGWEFSGNFGAYWGNKYQASFYSGAKTNINNIDYVLSNKYWNDEIKNTLMTTVNRDSFMLSELPTNLKYSSTMHVGFSGRYNFNPEWALNMEFNFTKLTAKDFFTLEVFPSFDNESHSYLRYPIWGIETRMNIQTGVIHTFNKGKRIRPFFEIGAVFTNTVVKESKISIENSEYNLINIYSGNYVPNSNIQEYQIRQGGISVGGYTSGGVKYALTNFVSLELLASYYYNQIKLENYEAYKSHYALMFRLVLSPAFFMTAETK